MSVSSFIGFGVVYVGNGGNGSGSGGGRVAIAVAVAVTVVALPVTCNPWEAMSPGDKAMLPGDKAMSSGHKSDTPQWQKRCRLPQLPLPRVNDIIVTDNKKF